MGRLALQLEGSLNAGELCREGLIDFQALLDGVAAVDDGGVVATADELTDARSGHLGIFLGKIHRNLAHKDVVALAALAEDVLLRHVVVVADFLQDVVDGQRLVIDLHGTLDDALCQSHVDIGVIDDAIGQQGVDDALEVAHGAVGSLGDELDDVSGNLQTVAQALGIEDVDAQLGVGLLQLGNESAGETGQHAVLQPLQIHGGTVGGEDDLLAQAEQVVEDMEEGIDRALGSGPLLHIVDDEHVDGLVEVDKIVDGVLTAGVRELHLEEAC